MAQERPEAPQPVEGRAAAESPEPVKLMRLSATWTVAALGTLMLLLLLVFILQNTQREDFESLWFEFRLPVGAALLLAGTIGASSSS